MGEDLSQFADLFVSESRERVGRLNNLLLDYEKSQNKDLLEEMMRESHTLKGMAATMEFNKLAFFCHVLEDVFDYARNGVIKIPKKSALIDVVYSSLDKVEECLEKIEKSGEEINLEELAEKIKSISGVQTSGTGQSPRVDGKPVLAPRETTKNNENLVKSKKSKATKEQVKPREEIDNPSTQGVSKEKLDNIRVKVELLDNIMSITEDLVLNKLKLQRIAKTGNTQDLEKTIDSVEILVKSLQYEIMNARLVPVEFALQKFPRLVRDLSEHFGKEINLDIVGSDIEFDRSIVEELSTPLVHLIRNSVDHGIDKKGKIKIEAKRTQNLAVIEVSDNGVGMDVNEIREIAIKKGVISQAEIKKLNEKQILSLVYDPRFSSSKKVTEISGRGVGLSAVKESVLALRGRIELETAKNNGSKFILKFPLTLAITKAFIIGVGDKQFAVPVVDVIKIVDVKKDALKKIANEHTFILEGEDIYIIPLKNRFYGSNEDFGISFSVLVVKNNEDKFALKVDYLVGEKEIVVKPIPPKFKNKYVSAITVLEDGRIIPILNVSEF